MSYTSSRLILTCVVLTSWTGIGDAQEAQKPAGADPTEIIRSIVQDPSIRNQVGPSENAWDFTKPESVPGFCPMQRDGEPQ